MYFSYHRLDILPALGSECYLYIPKCYRKKFDKKSEKCYLVGYKDGSDNYRVYSSKNHKVIVARDVNFNNVSSGNVFDVYVPIGNIHDFDDGGERMYQLETDEPKCESESESENACQPDIDEPIRISAMSSTHMK